MRLFVVERLPQPAVNEPSPWRNVETGKVYQTWRDLPCGAMWDAEWMPDPYRVNGTGPRWTIKLPNGSDFMPGARANNCTRPDEDHDCWCVHGEAPNISVDKHPEPGRSTCDAGGGSVASGKKGEPGYWHGFITNGEPVQHE